jgi:hypothetical protein
MLSEEEILDVVCTEAIEYGGLQEVPGQKHGARQSYHSPKRGARGSEQNRSGRPESDLAPAKYPLRLVRKVGGDLDWED